MKNPFHNLLKALATGAIASTIAGTASAQTVINLAGSTAFRASTHTAIQSILTSGSYAYTGSTLGSANFSIFRGITISGSNDVIVRCSWSGSVEGIRDVAQQNNLPFLPTTTTTMSSGGSGGLTDPGAATDTAKPEVGLSDVFQGSTIYTSPTLQDTQVAIVPFKWISNQDAPGTLTNVTPQTVRNLYKNGFMELSLLTGSNANSGTFVYALGRNNGSGTRATALAETVYGINTPVFQWTATTTGSNAGTVVTGISAAGGDGNGGYSSGGGVAGVLSGTSFTNLAGYLIGYLGLPDSTTAVGNGAHELKYNGVSYSPTAVYEGQYTFWGYEHLFYNAATIPAAKKTVADAIVTSLAATPGAAGLKVSDMNVNRAGDGATVVHK